MFDPPPDDPFLDSSGFALEAIFEDPDERRVGSGYIGSLSSRAMMATIALDDESFSGQVQFQRRSTESGDPSLWDPLLRWDESLRQWEPMSVEDRRPFRIVVSMLFGRGMLDDGDDGDSESEEDE